MAAQADGPLKHVRSHSHPFAVPSWRSTSVPAPLGHGAAEPMSWPSCSVTCRTARSERLLVGWPAKCSSSRWCSVYSQGRRTALGWCRSECPATNEGRPGARGIHRLAHDRPHQPDGEGDCDDHGPTLEHLGSGSRGHRGLGGRGHSTGAGSSGSTAPHEHPVARSEAGPAEARATSGSLMTGSLCLTGC
jgi:hypothetical protein